MCNVIKEGNDDKSIFLTSDLKLGILEKKVYKYFYTITQFSQGLWNYTLQKIIYLLTRTYLKPYNITFAPALILQNTKGITPIVGVRYFAPWNIPHMHMIAYGVHPNNQTTINPKIIFASLLSIWTFKIIVLYFNVWNINEID